MADISITAASVAYVSGNMSTRNAGATITAGQACCIDSSNTWQLSDADGAAAAKKVDGIALHDSRSGQPLTCQATGDITIGGTVAAGTLYVSSTTAGAISNSAVASGSTLTIIGYGISTTQIRLVLNSTGIAVP